VQIIKNIEIIFNFIIAKSQMNKETISNANFRISRLSSELMMDFIAAIGASVLVSPSICVIDKAIV